MPVSTLKTLTYCVMHLVVAVAVAFALTRDLQAALAIGVVEPFVQTFAFVFHDRFWSRHDGRRGGPLVLHGGCTHGGLSAGAFRLRRPLLGVTTLKTLSYGLMHMAVAIAVAYTLTGSWTAALAIGTVEPIFQTAAFALHDRYWARRDGRRPALPGPRLQPALVSPSKRRA
jgi:uncharacterized membrane protein